MNFVNQKNLGGVMVYSIEMDDFSGECKIREESNKYLQNPLLQAIKSAFQHSLNSASINKISLLTGSISALKLIHGMS